MHAIVLSMGAPKATGSWLDPLQFSAKAGTWRKRSEASKPHNSGPGIHYQCGWHRNSNQSHSHWRACMASPAHPEQALFTQHLPSEGSVHQAAT